LKSWLSRSITDGVNERRHGIRVLGVVGAGTVLRGLRPAVAAKPIKDAITGALPASER
jgi:hypothetical protein